MIVETYDMLETMENQIAEIDDESNLLIDELNLSGQKGLRNVSGERRPYNLLTEQQLFVCGNLFPECSTISSYSAGPIPYRVLKEIKTAIEHFKFLYIIYETPAIVKDPVLIGSNSEVYGWNKGADKYRGCSLIARWGEALAPWEELFKQAKDSLTKRTHEMLVSMKTEIERAIKLSGEGIAPTNSQFNMASIQQLMPYKFE